ncbi:unnamed protein product [Debaryomyces tyrocola]|nr:unnamed protein product [Debaryomyces tyrocola]
MSEVFPISCISCRRKKIKCNKVRPCNQCEKRQICCIFPSTFRNIKINEDELDNPSWSGHSGHSSSNGSGENSSVGNSESDYMGNQLVNSHSRKLLTLAEEVNHLKTEKNSISEEHNKLKQKYQLLLTQLNKFHRSSNSNDKLQESFKLKDPIPISGETSELGDKYYGPLSSNYMIKNLDKGGSNKNDEKTSIKDEGMGLKSRKPSSNDLLQIHESFSSQANQDLIKKSLLKKPLPYLLGLDFIIGPRNLSKTNVDELNFNIICKLVDYFFSYHPVYKTFISKQQIVDFLNNYDDMNDNEWENDDDLLLLLMILLLLIQRLTAKEFIDINLLDNVESQTTKFKKVKDHLTDILYHKFEKIRHNLINEAVATIQSYILCTEWHFIEQRYEECWSMMFHTCSISYSIGLHVMGKFSLLDEQPLKEKDEDVTRYKVWFALKNISGQVCSVLGRPNPISIHVNSQILKVSDPSHSKQDLKKFRMAIALKIGLSECLKLSNMMLIENFMTDFTIRDLLELDTKFKREIDLIKWFINDELYDNDNLVDDRNIDLMDEDSNYMKNEVTLIVDKTNLLVDLIAFYINRAKLFQPFIVEFENPGDTVTVVRLLHDSINKYMDCSIYFINTFLKQFGEKYKENEFEYLKKPNFGKLLRVHFPFLNSFIYQGMLVIFTFLHHKFKDFVEYDESVNNEDINYSEFLNKLDKSLNTLLKLESNFAKMTSYNNKLWSSNITHLVRMNIEHIGKIRHKQNSSIEIDHQKFESDLNELQNQINLGNIPEPEFQGFNLRDPFWITNPDNLPYHLSSPSDDEDPSKSRFKEENSKNTGSDPNKSVFSNNPELPKHPQPLHSSQVTPNMLVGDFNSQADAAFDDIWSSNSSYPSKSNSSLSQHPQPDLSSVQQERPAISDSYGFLNMPQQSLIFTHLSNLPHNPSQMLGTLNDTNYPTQLQRFSKDDSQQKNLSNDDSEVFNPDAF